MKATRLSLDFGLALGLVLLLGGGLLVLDHMGLLGSSLLAGWWFLGLAGLGAAQLVFGDNRVAKITGAGLILFAGVLLLIDLEPREWLDAGSYVWRIALASIGLSLVARACVRGGTSEPAPQPVSSGAAEAYAMPTAKALERVQIFTLLSSQERKLASDSFVGGQLTSIMGSYELDLRGAEIPEGCEAVLDVFSLMGEGRVRVPEDWTVVSDVVPILADVRMTAGTRDPRSEKRLRVRGLALMSDIEVRN